MNPRLADLPLWADLALCTLLVAGVYWVAYLRGTREEQDRPD